MLHIRNQDTITGKNIVILCKMKRYAGLSLADGIDFLPLVKLLIVVIVPSRSQLMQMTLERSYMPYFHQKDKKFYAIYLTKNIKIDKLKKQLNY